MSGDSWLGIVVTIITGVLVAIISLRLEYKTGLFNARQRKELTYEIVSKAPLVSKNQEHLSDKLEILYDKKLVQVVESIVIEIANTGNKAIASGDIEKNLSLSFPGRILDVSITQTIPKDLQVELQQTHDSMVEIQPLLLNRNESIRLAVVIADPTDDPPKVAGRIIDASITEKKRTELSGLMDPSEDHISFIAGMIIGPIALLIGAGVRPFLIDTLPDTLPSSLAPIAASAIILLLGLLLAFLALILIRFLKKYFR